MLALWIGIGWLIRGITQTLAAASDQNMPARGWRDLPRDRHVHRRHRPHRLALFRSVAVLTLVGAASGWSRSASSRSSRASGCGAGPSRYRHALMCMVPVLHAGVSSARTR
ncbi:hypothetical protein ACRAWF_28435 [Streptomyces sp. L7]